MELELEREGYAILPQFLDSGQIDFLRQQVESLSGIASAKSQNGIVYGMRDLLRHLPDLRFYATSPQVQELVKHLLGRSAQLVRAIYFNKTSEANWNVLWHQDTTIAVKNRLASPSFEAWSIKDGIHHARPEAGIMERMVTLRIHLDACDETNGALRVLPGTHLNGRMSDAEVKRMINDNSAVLCCVPAGGVIAMKPLLLHASSAGTLPSQRRVLHFEFSPDVLPGGLEWYDAV